jgi:hypothetical protein
MEQEMGRSYLSIKLALAFGLCIAALVTFAGRSAVHLPVRDEVTRAESVAAPRQVQAQAMPAPEDVVCLWRACPLMPPQPTAPAAPATPVLRSAT